MNALSAISIIICTSFFIGATQVVTAERKRSLNISACAVLSSLGWWSFCNAFFFAAATKEHAFFWHKLGSIGWCGFVAVTAYYFLALTNNHKKMNTWWKYLLFFAPAILLICKNLFGSTTSLAQNVILSFNHWGWTYENSITSFWLWVYLLYVALYFGIAFYLLYQWAKSVKHKMKQEMAITFIILDVVTILFGIITDVIFPVTYPFYPALASVGTALFGIGYFGIIYRYDVFNINLVISPDDILQTSNNPVFVMDETGEILKCNHAAGMLLGYSKKELIGLSFTEFLADNLNFNTLHRNEVLSNRESRVRCQDGTVKDVLVSTSIATDKHHNFVCMILSCQDVSEQKKIQKELKHEQERYKKLAENFQKLAYYDPLTNLPNRRHFYDVLSEYETRYQTEKEDFAVIFLDINDFKNINDKYGHKFGDEVLKSVADKLKSRQKNRELAARLGGDEFLFVMPCTNITEVEEKLQVIKMAFCDKTMVDTIPCDISLAAGYGVFSQHEDITKIVQKADHSMYENKKRDKGL